jgi:hypothetical protein
MIRSWSCLSLPHYPTSSSQCWGGLGQLAGIPNMAVVHAVNIGLDGRVGLRAEVRVGIFAYSHIINTIPLHHEHHEHHEHYK